MFHFKLQPVLDYRKMLEEKLMTEYADIRNRLDTDMAILARLRSEVSGLISELKEKGKGNLNAAEVSFYLSYINRMRGEGKKQEEVVCNTNRELEDKRGELSAAASKRKVLEILKDKKIEEYRDLLNSREQKELDEAVILRSGRGTESEKADTYM